MPCMYAGEENLGTGNCKCKGLEAGVRLAWLRHNKEAGVMQSKVTEKSGKRPGQSGVRACVCVWVHACVCVWQGVGGVRGGKYGRVLQAFVRTLVSNYRSIVGFVMSCDII